MPSRAPWTVLAAVRGDKTLFATMEPVIAGLAAREGAMAMRISKERLDIRGPQTR
jgi:hypothetical protein